MSPMWFDADAGGLMGANQRMGDLVVWAGRLNKGIERRGKGTWILAANDERRRIGESVKCQSSVIV